MFCKRLNHFKRFIMFTVFFWSLPGILLMGELYSKRRTQHFKLNDNYTTVDKAYE